MQKNFELLFAKQHKNISEQLQDAVLGGFIQSEYVPVPEKKSTETVKQYTRRLVVYSSTPQFVRVIFNGQHHYVSFGVSGPLITKHGTFQIIPAQVVGGRWGVHYFLFNPSFEIIKKQKNVFIRLDSGCVSGQIFEDITCDCKEQLEISVRACQEKGGLIVNIPSHDGRGWGEYKMANQLLMHQFGLDTVRAARLFYGEEAVIDQRTYTEAVIILKAFGFNEKHKFTLATNNPRKIGAFTSLGIKINVVEPVIAKKTSSGLLKSLKAKEKEWGHHFKKTRMVNSNNIE